jgi:hypothetical protein
MNFFDINGNQEIIMKSTITSISAALMMLAMAGAHSHEFYSVFGGNPDLYSGITSSQSLPVAAQTGDHDFYASGTNDFYASILNDVGITHCPVVAQVGSNDDFGSSLLDVGHDISW